jgi:hypothetical protein
MREKPKGGPADSPMPGGSAGSGANSSGGLRSRFQRWASANPEAIARLMVWLHDQRHQETDEPGLLTLGRSFLLNIAPPNWQSLPAGAHVQVDRLICETGLCLVWVPDAEVIVGLIRASGKGSRDEVLLTSADRILDSVIARTDQVNHPELAGLRELAVEAVETHRSGFFAASQTLAAAILTGVIEDHYGFRFVAAREAFDAEPPARAGLWSHRRTLVQRAIQIAIVPSKYRREQSGFNRHLTSHGTDTAHYEEARAIEALMLMAAALRELNETYRIAEMGFGASPRLERYATKHLSLASR